MGCAGMRGVAGCVGGMRGVAGCVGEMVMMRG